MGEGYTPPENAKIPGLLRSYALYFKSICEGRGGGGGGKEGEGLLIHRLTVDYILSWLSCILEVYVRGEGGPVDVPLGS